MHHLEDTGVCGRSVIVDSRHNVYHIAGLSEKEKQNGTECQKKVRKVVCTVGSPNYGHFGT